MTWLAWRRHRLMLVIVLGLFVALVVWMIFVAHTFDVAAMLRRTNNCPVSYGGVRNYCTGDDTQARVIELVLLAFPCIIGVVLGAPLVASELHANTNRLSWTQGISRTKWFVTKWLLIATTLVAATLLFELVVTWWRPHVNSFGGSFLPTLLPTFNRMVPGSFAITGIVPAAYVLFAFSLGVALGAVIRRTPWAIAGTLLVYTGVALLMVLVVRPNLLPQTFVSYAQEFPSSGTYGIGAGQAAIPAPIRAEQAKLNQAWNVDSGYRYRPGFQVPSGAPSAGAAGQGCEDRNYNTAPFLNCLSTHGLQQGQFFQAANHYWPLQWIESGIYVLASILLFVAGLLSVRRWRA